MRGKPVIPRERALTDIQEAVDFYLEEGGDGPALAFAEALEWGFVHVGRHPASGSLRFAHELAIPDLRAWPLGRFPYLLFYVEMSHHVDVWRVLHVRRDLPAWMSPAPSR